MKNNYNKFFLPILSGVVLILTIVFFIFDLDWIFYLLGVVLGLITHIILLIQDEKRFDVINTHLGKELYRPKKSAFIWVGLRSLIVILYLGVVFILAYFLNYNIKPLTIFIMVGGYITVKVIFIISLLKGERL